MDTVKVKKSEKKLLSIKINIFMFIPKRLILGHFQRNIMSPSMGQRHAY